MPAVMVPFMGPMVTPVVVGPVVWARLVVGPMVIPVLGSASRGRNGECNVAPVVGPMVIPLVSRESHGCCNCGSRCWSNGGSSCGFSQSWV